MPTTIQEKECGEAGMKVVEGTQNHHAGEVAKKLLEIERGCLRGEISRSWQRSSIRGRDKVSLIERIG
jgi:hypothetical protein